MCRKERSCFSAPLQLAQGMKVIKRKAARLFEFKEEDDENYQLRNDASSSAEITYFQPDEFQRGDTITIVGNVSKIDEYERIIILKIIEILINDIYQINCCSLRKCYSI